MKGQTAQLRRLDAQVLERLGAGINDLVDELALNLVRGERVPPEDPVEDIGHGLNQHLGHVQVPPFLDDLAVDELGDLGGGVVCRAVQLIGLLRRGVVFDHGG